MNLASFCEYHRTLEPCFFDRRRPQIVNCVETQLCYALNSSCTCGFDFKIDDSNMFSFFFFFGLTF